MLKLISSSCCLLLLGLNVSANSNKTEVFTCPGKIMVLPDTPVDKRIQEDREELKLTGYYRTHEGIECKYDFAVATMGYLVSTNANCSVHDAHDDAALGNAHYHNLNGETIRIRCTH